MGDRKSALRPAFKDTAAARRHAAYIDAQPQYKICKLAIFRELQEQRAFSLFIYIWTVVPTCGSCGKRSKPEGNFVSYNIMKLINQKYNPISKRGALCLQQNRIE